MSLNNNPVWVSDGTPVYLLSEDVSCVLSFRRKSLTDWPASTRHHFKRDHNNYFLCGMCLYDYRLSLSSIFSGGKLVVFVEVASNNGDGKTKNKESAVFKLCLLKLYI